MSKNSGGLKVIVGKGRPSCQRPWAVSFPQYGRGHDSESADRFHTDVSRQHIFSPAIIAKNK